MSWWGCKFRRTPASGALRWGTESKVVGDIVATGVEDFPFTLEVKNRENWDFKEFFTGKGQLPSYFEQSVRDAERVNKTPLLFITKNYHPYYLVMRVSDIPDRGNILEEVSHFYMESSFGYLVCVTAEVGLKILIPKECYESGSYIRSPSAHEGTTGLGAQGVEAPGEAPSSEASGPGND